MAQHLEEMPLFPLPTVLFPYASLSLHIREDRYRQMIQHCTSYDRPFGIVLTRTLGSDSSQVEPYMVGTAARVLNVNTYDDGQMDVIVRGERRFRIRQLDEDGPFWLGQVEPVIEMEAENDPRVESLTMDLRDRFRMLIEGVIGAEDYVIKIEFPPDPTALSFKVASYLSLDNLEKQRLLETTNTSERLAELLALIERQIVQAAVREPESDNPAAVRMGPHELDDWIFPN